MAKRRARGEGTVHQRSDGRWVGQIDLGRTPDGRRDRRTVYGDTQGEAATELRRLLDARDKNLPILDPRITLGDFLAWWVDEHAAKRLRPRTRESYAQVIDAHIAAHLGEVPLAKLRPVQVQAWLDDRHSAGVSARTCGYARAILRSALQDAVRLELAHRNVAKLVRVPRYDKREGRALTQAEALALLQAAAGTGDEVLVLLALALGLREGELLGLQWDDLQLPSDPTPGAATLRIERQAQLVRDPQTLRRSMQLVPLKTRRSRRTLPVLDAIVQALELQAQRVAARREVAEKGAGWTDLGLVFPTRRGTIRSPRNLARAWDTLRTRAGLSGVRFHDLRHSTTSFLLALGTDPRTMMELLGHSQITTTLGVYAHTAKPQQVAAAEKLGAMLQPVRPDPEGEALSRAKSPSRLVN